MAVDITTVGIIIGAIAAGIVLVVVLACLIKRYCRCCSRKDKNVVARSHSRSAQGCCDSCCVQITDDEDDSSLSDYDLDEVDSRAERLDLHGYSAADARQELINFLAREQYEYRNGRRATPYAHIITGRGKHSVNGPVIKPMTEQYLRNQNYDYKWAHHGGMVTVDLTSL